MSRRIHRPVAVQAHADGRPLAFNYRGIMYRVKVLSHWRLATRWWEPADAADRHYYRVQTADCQIYELYRDDGQGGAWVLETIQD